MTESAPGEWRPEVTSEDFLTSSDLIATLVGAYIGENRPTLTEREARHIGSMMWHRLSGYAQYRYTLGFRHGCDYQKRELEDAALRAALPEESTPAPSGLPSAR